MKMIGSVELSSVSFFWSWTPFMTWHEKVCHETSGYAVGGEKLRSRGVGLDLYADGSDDHAAL